MRLTLLLYCIVSCLCLPRALALPDLNEAAWQHYYQRSAQILAADEAFIAAELATLKQQAASLPAATRRFGFDTNAPASVYLTEEGKALLSSILSLQTPSGGWSKRTDMSIPRQPGQHFGVEPKYVPTFDNDATTSQLRVLARAYSVSQHPDYANAFERGLKLIFAAQYPHGGWPQNYPLRGGYHDHVTLNDEATENLLSLLWDSAQAQGEFSWIAPALRQQALQHFERGLALILQLQQQDGQGLSLWAAQYHHRTLEPAWARAYEMPALATAESATLLDFLMSLPSPSAELKHAIVQAMRWYQHHALYDKHWHSTKRELLDEPGAGPIWPRFAELDSNKAVFGDRDGELYYQVEQVSLERRQGYAWYTDKPVHTLARFEQWRQHHLP